MEIVINIDEKLYKELKCNLTNPMFGTVIDEIVANGTPLPKGHGRLGDLDELENHLLFLDKTISESTVVGQAEHKIVMEILESTMNVLTIIDADKGEEE